jgi:hypothetical protein
MAADPSDGGLKCPGFATQTRSCLTRTEGAHPAQHPHAQSLRGPDLPPPGMAERAAIPDPGPMKGAGQIEMTGSAPPPHRAHALSSRPLWPKRFPRWPPTTKYFEAERDSSPTHCGFASEAWVTSASRWTDVKRHGYQDDHRRRSARLAAPVGVRAGGPVRAAARRDGEQRNHPTRWRSGFSTDRP